MATILASRGGILRPDYEQDREKTREKIAIIRTEACQHDKNGDVMFANEARRHARRLEIMWDLTPRSPYGDPMGVVADAIRDQAEARAEDEVLKQQEHMCNCVPDEECCGGESDE